MLDLFILESCPYCKKVMKGDKYMVERSLVLIKPDAVERNLIGKMLTIYEDNNLKIRNMRLTEVSREVAEAHYMEHKGQDYSAY